MSVLAALPRDRRLIVGGAIVALFLAMAILPGLFTAQDPAGLELERRLAPPSADHWMGTNGVGTDIYARVVHGARTTLATVVVVLAIWRSMRANIGR